MSRSRARRAGVEIHEALHVLEAVAAISERAGRGERQAERDGLLLALMHLGCTYREAIETVMDLCGQHEKQGGNG